MTFKPPGIVVNVASMSGQAKQEMEQYVIDEIRKRINDAFLGEVISPKAIHGIEATFRNVLKEMERAGVIERPLTEQDVSGIIEIMKLEWSLPDYDGPRIQGFTGYTIPVSAPDVRNICGALSDQAIKAMTAPYEEFGACENTARFFFLEKLRREGVIQEWSFTWTDPRTRSGDLTITPSFPIQYVSGLVGVEP